MSHPTRLGRLRSRERGHSRAGAVVVAAAGMLAASLIGTAAAPPDSAPAARPASSGRLPTVSPTPQQVRARPRPVVLTDRVHLVTGEHTDPRALSDLTAILRRAGVSHIDRSASPAGGGGRVLNVWVGGPAEGNPGSADELEAFGVPGPAGLAGGGYVLVAGSHGGRAAIVLSGVDGAGTFYAVQTLRQLLTPHGRSAVVTGVEVRDWPSFPVRAGGETFYGDPWPQADALHQMRFLGRHKMNGFLYTPSGDTRTSGRLWREPYPPGKLAKLQAIVDKARANHVDYMYRIDPESPTDQSAGICHSDPDDLKALVKRYEQLWSIGIRTVLTGWDDSSGKFRCDSDTAKFGDAPSPLAAAQLHVMDYVQTHFMKNHPGARFITVPAEYAGDGPSTYRSEFAAGLPDGADIFWTGPQVGSPTITREDFDRATKAFGGRQLLIFDNYPVNDYAPNRQFLGPLTGRDPALAEVAGGIMSNEMREEEPSLIPLFTIGDFAWNADAYDAQDSWRRSLAEFGGPGADALRTYAENSIQSILTDEAAPAQPLIADLLHAYRTGMPIHHETAKLDALLRETAAAPGEIRAKVDNADFLRESSPWLDKLHLDAVAGSAAVEELTAQDRGDRAGVKKARDRMESLVTKAEAIPQVVAPGVYEKLTDFAADEADRFLSAHPSSVTPDRKRQLVAAGTQNTVDFTFTGLASGTLTATVSGTAPEGWKAEPTSRTISLDSDHRTVTTTVHLRVTPPDGAAGTTAKVGVAVEIEGQDTVTATTAATVGTVPTADYSALVLGQDPVGYWRLDGAGATDSDSSGYGNDGSDVNEVSHQVPGALAGTDDTAVRLDGGYVNVPNSPSVALDGSFTLEAWFKTTTSGQQQAIIERYDHPWPNGEVVRIGSDNHLHGYVNSATETVGVRGSSSVTPDVWHHVAVTCDGTTLKVYLDGLLDGTTKTKALPGAGSGDLRLGARGDDAGLRLQGGLDEAAVYPTALSPGQIRSHYLAGVIG